VKATSIADSSKSDSATVTITPTVAVNVSPKTVQLLIGTQQQFTATVTGNPNNSVTWTIAGTGCSGAACGTITSTGLYTAPNAVPNPPQVFVTATSVADPTKSGTATVTIVPPVSVSVSPKTATVLAGGQQQFTATVAGTPNTTVTWSLAGTGCSGAACGTITSTGLYTAPGTVPSPAQVNVTATSVADPTKSATATVTVTGPISVSVSPKAAQVVTGAHLQFTATVTGTTIKGVTWTVTGAGCSGATCGTITSAGLYTAPGTVPNPAQVTVKATSVADNSKSDSASVTITGPVFVTVSPKVASVVVGAQQQFTATVTGLSNHSVTWSVTGVGCSGTVCGTITSTGLYTAPKTVPNGAQVFVTATSVADPTESGTASVTIVPPVTISISPTSTTVPVGDHRQFLATVSGTGDTSVTWSVSGAGCSGATCGIIDSGGRYAAPATVPNPAVVTVKVTSVADPTKFATATVTILPGLVVRVSPTTAQVRAGDQQQFTATVTGSTHTGVTWKVSGAGCSGAACGTITSTGLYTAPGTVPNPAQVTVTATSAFDFSKSDSATVTILQGIAVSVAPPTAQVVVGTVKHFIATVTGTANTAVTWSLSGAGCSGSACGTINSAGFYTAPATVPNPAKVTVTATSVADNTKSASAVVTIIHPVVVIISPTSVNVAVNGQQQFQATVIGSTNTTVIWSVSGAGCSGAGCGTITSGGLYTAPASVPSPAIVIVKASSQIDVTESASATVTIVPSENSKLDGRFAFLFTGFDSSGVYQAAGSFVADGNGNITSGHEDVNDTAGPATNLAISGTYQVESNNRGLLKLSSTLGTQQFKFALDVLGTKGRFIAFDTTGIRGSGVFEQQDTSAFSTSALTGSYALSLTGKDGAGARVGALAVILPNGFGGIAGGSMDVNDGGTLLETLGVNGGYSISNTGRGTLTLTVPGFAGGTFHFAIYMISTGKFNMVSTDQLSSSNPIFSGPAEMQTGTPFRTSNFNGVSIFSLGGASGNVSQVTVGRLFFDGRSQLLAQFDQNTGGTVTNNLLTGAYDVQLNGRGTLNLDNSGGSVKVWIMYAIAPNKSFLMDASTSDVGMGELNPQTTNAPFSNADIVGTYVLGSGEPLVPTASLFSGSTSFDGKANAQNLGFVSGIEDISRSSGLSPSQTLSGAYSVSKVSNTGRGTLVLTAPDGSTIVLWVTSSSEVVGMGIDATNTQPIVLHFEQ
jgi:Fe-S cluster assembly iron-binding protein IscA